MIARQHRQWVDRKGIHWRHRHKDGALQTCLTCDPLRFNGPAVPFRGSAGPRNKLVRSITSESTSPVFVARRSRRQWVIGFAMLANDPPKRLRFGVFEADLRTGELTKHGRRLSLQEQPFRLLALLLERPGELVTREELHGRLWPQTIVDFDHGLNKAVSKIREALGDSAENPRFIETVARRGYRFLADVAVIRGGQPEILADDLAACADLGLLRLADAGTSPRRPPRAWRLFGVGLALVLAISLCGSSTRGDPPAPRFTPWRCCRWKTFPAMLRRITSSA
jgi:DNA-binding winged helix-turn-helix (wHTH) protein